MAKSEPCGQSRQVRRIHRDAETTQCSSRTCRRRHDYVVDCDCGWSAFGGALARARTAMSEHLDPPTPKDTP